MDNLDFLNPDVMDLSGNDSQGADNNLVLDLDGVSEELPKFEPIPPGVYDAVVENVEFGQSSTNNPMLTFQLRVTEDGFENRMLFTHAVLNKESGLTRLKRFLVRVCPDVSLTGFSPSKFADEGEILGYPCRVKVNIKPYKGEKRNNVVDVLAPEASGDSFLND